MIVIEPRIRNNICITAHPQGCAAQVRIYSTVIKPIGRPFTARGIDFRTCKITEMTAETVTEEEVLNTVKMDRLYLDFDCFRAKISRWAAKAGSVSTTGRCGRMFSSWLLRRAGRR